ncbi:hypothetical protein GOODEAATRI_013846, partial [Goodea atripinnis]
GGCSNSCAFIWVMAPQEVRSYPLSWLCWEKVNPLYFEKFQKSMYRSLMLKSMAVGPNPLLHVPPDVSFCITQRCPKCILGASCGPQKDFVQPPSTGNSCDGQFCFIF